MRRFSWPGEWLMLLAPQDLASISMTAATLEGTETKAEWSPLTLAEVTILRLMLL